MLDKTDDIAVATDNWLGQFEEALAQPDDGALKTLFHPDSYWRDVLALSWNIQTINGRDAILKTLPPLACSMAPSGFAIAPDRAAPRKVMRAGTNAIEAIFKFKTKVGRGSGIIRLIPDADDGNRLKAWTLLTELGELKGFEEQLGVQRPRGNAYSRDFRGPNWLDLRKQSAGYADRDPTVLVIGGGQSGLSIAARLKQLNVDTLIVDREQRIGDNWRKRYHALTLHNQVQVEPPAVHALPAELADLHPQGQARQLVRSLCRGHGAELLDRDRIRGRQLRREGRPLDRDAAARRRHQAHHASASCGAGDRRQRDSERA